MVFVPALSAPNVAVAPAVRVDATGVGLVIAVVVPGVVVPADGAETPMFDAERVPTVSL